MTIQKIKETMLINCYQQVGLGIVVWTIRFHEVLFDFLMVYNEGLA